MIPEAIPQKGTGKYQETIAFIRQFYQLFRLLQNVVLLTVFDVLQSRKTPSTFSEKTNAF